MGVPGFYYKLKSISSRNRIEIETESEGIEISHLLVDANSFIYTSAQQVKRIENYNKLSKEEIEAKIIENVIDIYIGLVKKIKPKKSVYIAIDGVCPLAKVKQQRTRRYKRYYDLMRENESREICNEKANKEWNTISITPGTEFMKKLDKEIVNKITEYNKEHEIKIEYTSYKDEGEGEHKIMEYIKKKNISKDEKILITGLDTDLIFLTLTLKDQTVYLLREIRYLNAASKEATGEYLDKELVGNKDLVYRYVDMSKVIESIKEMLTRDSKKKITYREIDDFIFLCFTIGNDFIPHIPNIEINDRGLEDILKSYNKVSEWMKMNLIDREKLTINHAMLLNIIKSLKHVDDELFDNRNNYKYLLDKKRGICKRRLYDYRSMNSNTKCARINWDMEKYRLENLYMYNKEDIYEYVSGMKTVDEMIEKIDKEYTKFDEYRYDYYNRIYEGTEQYKVIEDICKEYLKGLKFVMLYYFDKIPSWRWYYKYQLSPFITDLDQYLEREDTYNINNNKFTKDKVISNEVQILTVIPRKDIIEISPQYKMITEDKRILYTMPDDFDIYKDSIIYYKCEPKIPDMDINVIEKIVKEYKKSKRI